VQLLCCSTGKQIRYPTLTCRYITTLSHKQSCDVYRPHIKRKFCRNLKILIHWQFFIVCENPCKAKCKRRKVCTQGRTPKTYSTKSLLDQLHWAHSTAYAQLKLKASKLVETTSRSTIRLLNDKPGYLVPAQKNSQVLQILWFAKALPLLYFCQVILIFAFGKLTIPVKHLCKITGDMCFAPIHMASKLQVCHLFY